MGLKKFRYINDAFYLILTFVFSTLHDYLYIRVFYIKLIKYFVTISHVRSPITPENANKTAQEMVHEPTCQHRKPTIDRNHRQEDLLMMKMKNVRRFELHVLVCSSLCF